MSALQKRSFYGDPTYNPFERPSMPLSSLALDGVLGGGAGNDAGVSVDPLGGMGIPTAYRCIAILSTVVASCILEDVKKKSGEADTWDVLDNLLSYTAFEIKELIVAHLGGWGNFFSRKVYQGATLVDLKPIYPGNVDVIRVKGRKTFRVKRTNDDGTPVTDPSTPNMVLYDDYPDGPECPIFHIPGFGFDGLKGVSPIMIAAQTFGTAIAADRLAARFYSSGQQLGGIIKVKVPLANQGQADAIKSQWHTSHGGVGNAGGVAVLDAETDFTPITIAPEALQFLQSRQWQASEIAKMFGIPPFLVSDTASWGEIEEQWQGFVTVTLRSYTDRIEQRFTREFATRGHVLEFELDRLMRGQTMQRFQAYGQAIGWGWMTRAEVRSKERMKALDKKYGLEEPLTPQTMNGALADGPMAPAGANKANGAMSAGNPQQNQSKSGPAPTDPLTGEPNQPPKGKTK
jgi:HK97 family phage portal protein